MSDLAFYLPSCTSTDESAAGANDGAIEVLAEASSGTVKYNLHADFDYSTEGQTSTSFTGLTAGTYTVYARNSASSMASIEMIVEVAVTYSPRFTNQYYGLPENGFTPVREKWVILKRGYGGAVEEVNGVAVSTIGIQGKEDPFDMALVPSSYNIEMVAETVDQFLELYTDDDKEFMVILYRGASLTDVHWKGYLLSGRYSAAYDQQTGYTVVVEAADMLEDLKNIPFGNAAGSFPMSRMTIMEGVLMCLHRTDVELEIYEGIQWVIDGVNNSFDETSAIETARFDPLVYLHDDEPESCFDVLDGLMRSLTARIYQADGKWVMESFMLKTGGAFNVRHRDFDGALVSSGYIETNPRLLIRKSDVPGVERLVFQNRTQLMKIAETFGKVKATFDHSLKEQNQLLDSGDFTEVDLDSGQLNGWQIDYTDAPIIGTQIVNTRDGDQIYSSLKFIGSGSGIAATEIVLVESNEVPLIDPGTDYTIEVSFEVKMEQRGGYGVYTYFDYSVRLLDSDLPGDVYVLSTTDADTGNRSIGAPGSGDLIDDEWIRVYVDDPNQWTRVNFSTTIEQSGSFQSGNLQVRLRFGMNPVYDHVDQTSIQNEATLNILSTQTFDNRRKLKGEGGSTGQILLMKLEPGTEATSYPNVIRPTDYGGSNQYVWKLQGTAEDIQASIGVESWFNTAIVRNVVGQYLPEDQEPEGTTVVEESINTKIRNSKEVTIRHGDLPADENIGKVSRGWLSFEDGTPTTVWKMRHPTETDELPLVNWLALAMKGQFNAKRFKLTGDLNTMRNAPSFFNTFLELTTGKVYLPTFLSVDVKRASVNVELIESIEGTAVADVGQEVDPSDLAIPIEPPAEEFARVFDETFDSTFN